jgi:hypothetical protein
MAKGLHPDECTRILECVPESIVQKALEARTASVTMDTLVAMHK